MSRGTWATCATPGCTWRVSGTALCGKCRASAARRKAIQRCRRRREGRCLECNQALPEEDVVHGKAQCQSCRSASRQRWAVHDQEQEAAKKIRRR